MSLQSTSGPSMTQVSPHHSYPVSPRIHSPKYAPLTRPEKAHVPQQLIGHPTIWTQQVHRPPQHPGSVSSDDTASSSWSMQKPFPKPSTGHSSRLSLRPQQALMSNDLTSRGGIRGSHHAVRPQEEMMAGHRNPSEENATIYRYIQERGSPDEDDHAIWVLMWLSFLDPFMSLFSTIFTLVSTFIILLISPIHICHPSSSTSTLIIRTIAPVFRSHLRQMCAPSVEEAHTFDFKPGILILTQIISPLLSVGVAVAAWIAAAFWLFALMMGNPDGTERGDDGRAAVLGVRNWWEKFHLSAIR